MRRKSCGPSSPHLGIAEKMAELGTPVQSACRSRLAGRGRLGVAQNRQGLGRRSVARRDAQFQRIALLKAGVSRRGEPRVFARHQSERASRATVSQGSCVDATRVPSVRPRLSQLGQRCGDPSWDLRPRAQYRTHQRGSQSRHQPGSACDSLRWYWKRIGQRCYPEATSILLLCKVWREQLGQSSTCSNTTYKRWSTTWVSRFAWHYPSYCSKYNPIERRFFPHVGRACQGVLFDTLDTVRPADAECLNKDRSQDHRQHHSPHLRNRTPSF